MWTKLNDIIINGEVFETIKGECNRHCAFWNDKLCENILWYCTEKSCYFRYSPELTDKIKGGD